MAGVNKRRLATLGAALVGALGVSAAPAMAVPNTIIDTPPPNFVTNLSAPIQFEFHATNVSPPLSFSCSLDGVNYDGCASPDLVGGPLPDGKHKFFVKATDSTGTDPSPAARTFFVDTTAPNTTITRVNNKQPPPAQPWHTTDDTPTFRFNGSDVGGTGVVSFECAVSTDSGPPSGWAACSSPHTINPGMPDTIDPGQPHTFLVRAIDKAGNPDGSEAEFDFVVDTTGPLVTISKAPGQPDPATNPTKDKTPDFSFESDEAGTTFFCRIDGAAFKECPEDFTAPLLSDGTHEIDVYGVDKAGNKSSIVNYSFDVDGTAPDIAILTGPGGGAFISDSNPFHSFESPSDPTAGFFCRYDGDMFAACTSPYDPFSYTGSDLTDGQHKFSVYAEDAAGNQSPIVSRTFTVDTSDPVVTFIAPSPADMAALTNNMPVYHWTATDPAPGTTLTVECWLDGNMPLPCASPKELGPLPNGDYEFFVRATDQAGNVDTQSRKFSVDATIPDTFFLSTPPAVTEDDTPSFVFDSDEAPDVTFECRLNGLPVLWQACGALPTFGEETFGPLDDGVYVLEVRAEDLQGNKDPSPATYQFTVDADAPVVTIHSGPGTLDPQGTPIKDNTPTWTFSANEPDATFECRMGPGLPWAPCTSPFTPSPLADGQYTFGVRAISANGIKKSPPEVRWIIVDTGLPLTFITSAPPANGVNPFVTFEFISDDATATFKCRLKPPAGMPVPPFAACTSPQDYGPLPDGPHVFEVFAIDAAMNEGPIANWSFKIEPRCTNRVFSRWLGTAGPDVRKGKNGAEYMNGLGGNDGLKGSGGDDCLVGGAGNDALDGESGNDQIDGLDGVSGNDVIKCGDGEDVVWADAGDLINADCEVVETF